MFAYVKYDDGHKKTVPISDIKHFNPKEINYTKKYKILWEEEYYDGIIITVGDTAEEVDNIVSTKRQTVPQLKFCDSASETDTDNQLKRQTNNNTKDILKKKMDQMRTETSTAKNPVRQDTESSFQPLGERKNGNKAVGTKSKPKVVSNKRVEKKVVIAKNQPLLTSSNKQIEKRRKEVPKKTSGQKMNDETTTVEEVKISENDETQSMSKTNNKSKSSEHEVEFEDDKLEPDVTKGKKSSRAESSTTGVKNPTGKNEPPIGSGQKAADNSSDKILDGNDKPHLMSNATDNDRERSKHQVSYEDDKHGPDSENGTKGTKSKSGTTGKTKFPTGLGRAVANNGSRPAMPDVNNNGTKVLTDKLKEITLENARLKKNNAEYIRVQRDLKDQLKVVTNLNVKLQETVIKSQETVAGELEHLRSVMGDLKQLRVNPLNANQAHSAGDALVPVGYRRLDRQLIHIGQDEWITINNYNTIASTSKTPAQFVKQMACAVFSTPILKMSSVTGVVSNRVRANNPLPRPKLDPTKLLAIKDVLRYWLILKKKYGEVAADLEANLVGSHIGAKICDLNRRTGDEREVGNPQSDTEEGGNFENATSDNDLSDVARDNDGEEVFVDDTAVLCEAHLSGASDTEANESDETKDEEVA